MNNNIELKWNELKFSYQPSDFSFTTTEELKSSNGIIGQESALEALKLALKVNAKGYNIYVCGECGVGKWSAITDLLKTQSFNHKMPQDIIYVYNFSDPQIPRLILLQRGNAEKLKQDMDELIQFIIYELPIKLKSIEDNPKRQKVLEQLEKEKQQLLMELYEKSEQLGIGVKITHEEIEFLPLGDDGELITKHSYPYLAKTKKTDIDQKLSQLYLLADQMIERIRLKEQNTSQILKELEREVFLNQIDLCLKYLKQKYKAYASVISYLEAVGEDLADHFNLFNTADIKESKEGKIILEWKSDTEIDKLAKRYQINVIVDHTHAKGAPVTTDNDLETYNLEGKVLLSADMNVLGCDFTHIRSGLFHQANGGYLVLRAQHILEKPNRWQKIKKMLKTGYITVENPEDMNFAIANSIRPEALKADLKIILLGSYELYQLLYHYDEDFKKLFKIRIDFEQEIDSTKEQIYQLGEIIQALCTEENLPPVSLKGMLKLIEYGNRMTQNPKKLPANMGTLFDLVREASLFSNGVMDEVSFQKAIEQRQSFKDKIAKKLDEKISDGIYLIDTEGSRVGQVNALAIYTIQEYLLSRPVRITATTYKGKLGIIDIEKESGLGGDIHTKGIQIITGFMGHRFAQNMPLSLNCNICLEQSYSGIDGDSASSVELYAILSSLSEVPIKQNIAATGSVNQYGQIQAIGGVNEKIEGFFQICSQRGLKGDEGVIIPIQNKKELMLTDEIIEAVKTKKFHIYPVSTIEEGMEIITGYSYDDIARRVQQKLIKFNEKNF